MTELTAKQHYLYSWTKFSGYRQTIENGKVINIIEITPAEAQKQYYATREPDDILNDARLEESARDFNRACEKKEAEDRAKVCNG